MASIMPKPKEQDQIVVEEETGVFQRTVQNISPSTSGKRKEPETTSTESQARYMLCSDGRRSITVKPEEDSLTIPFWKSLNKHQSSIQFQVHEIGSFSLINRTDDKECFEDNRYLRVYKHPFRTLNVNFDLNVGESEFTSEGQSKNINAMLWWTLRHKKDVFKNNRFTFDFLSWRGVLRLIMFSLFEKNSDWLLAVVKFKNAYFLCEFVTDMQIKDEQNMTPENRTFCYYGHKFEEYVTKNETANETINPSKQFTGVFEAKIGSYHMLYGAEMDCVVEKSSSTREHIELKVCAGNSLEDLPFQYNRKFAKWWIQCFLVGIREMVIGLRDKTGIVSKLEPLNISDIERKTQTWSRQSFFNFFLNFAQFLEKHVTNEYSNDHKDVVLFHFLPSSQTIKMTKSSDPKYHFIPDWFSNEFP